MKQESEQFKIESTPVIDLKRAPVSDVWDNEKTEVYLEDDGGAGAAYLLTSEGDYLPISAFPFIIGRGNECDLVLNRKGISRKHAEIVFQSGRFVVNDLDSLNGLKVNGYKVARVILEEGDSIRLGEVNLVFTSSKQSSGGKSPDVVNTPTGAGATGEMKLEKSRVVKKVAIGIASLSLVVIAGAVAYKFIPALNVNDINQRIISAPNPTPVPSQEEKPVDTAVAAVATVAEPVTEVSIVEPAVPVVDPTAPPPSIGGIDSARDVAALNPPKAPEKKVTVPVEKPKPRETVPKASVAKANPVVKSTPQPIIESKVVVPNGSTASNSLDSRYLTGDVDALLNEMKAAIGSSRAADASYRNRYNAFVSLYNKYSSGKQAYIEGRKGEALQHWAAFLKEEKALLGGKKSVMASSVIPKVADEYLQLGNDAARTGKHHAAYKYWQSSLSFGDSVPARIALDAADQKSKQLYRQALRLEYVNTEKAKALWKQVMELVPPGTEYYTKSSSKLAWYEKWGA